MLVVTLGKVVFTRRMTPAENGVRIVQTRFRGLVADSADLDLDFAMIGQVYFLVGRKTPFSYTAWIVLVMLVSLSPMGTVVGFVGWTAFTRSSLFRGLSRSITHCSIIAVGSRFPGGELEFRDGHMSGHEKISLTSRWPTTEPSNSTGTASPS